MTKASNLSAAELLFAPRFVNRSEPEKTPQKESDKPAVAPKALLTRAERPAGTMHLPRKP
jgi:hypothetical protein